LRHVALRMLRRDATMRGGDAMLRVRHGARERVCQAYERRSSGASHLLARFLLYICVFARER